MGVVVICTIVAVLCFTILAFVLLWANCNLNKRDPWCLFCMIPIILGAISTVVATLNYSDREWEEYLVSKKHGIYAYQEPTSGTSSPSNQTYRRFQLKDMTDE